MNSLINESFPFNRKERFFTGTIFPGIVCRENFAHFDVLLKLLAPELSIKADWSDETKNILFYTEYNYKESLWNSAQRQDNQEQPKGDTPDILFFIKGAETNYLFALEGKMYDRPREADLRIQMDAQKEVLHRMAAGAGIKPEKIYHFALIPQKLKDTYTAQADHITWEALLEAYRFLGTNDYFLNVLDYALRHYDTFKSQVKGKGANADSTLPGHIIFEEYEERAIARVGRPKKLFKEDLVDGSWQTRSYQVSKDPAIHNHNWMPIQEFLKQIKEA